MPTRFTWTFVAILVTCVAVVARAELPPAFQAASGDRTVSDDTVRAFVTPKAILWKSDDSGQSIADHPVLLEGGTRQPPTVRAGL